MSARDERESAFDNLSIEPVSTVDRVVEELRRAVFEGELPPGTPLREMALAESLAVSRSTVREALGALVGEGLADRMPNRGTQVRALDPDAIHDVSRARLVVEMAGLQRWDAASEEARKAVRQALADFEHVAGTSASAAAGPESGIRGVVSPGSPSRPGCWRWPRRSTPRSSSPWPASTGSGATPRTRCTPTERWSS